MTKPAVIVISSHVVRGTVGNRAAVFALEALGFPVWAVPTIVLPWHPGHGPATRIVPPGDAFEAMLAHLERAPWLGEVGGVLTGYLGDAGQADPIARLIERVKARNPAARYICDPVIGDRGGLYVPRETAEAIRDRLLPLADIATPNRFELDWLTGSTSGDAAAMAAAARTAGPAAMVVTSAPAGDGLIGNLLVDREAAWLAAHEVIDRPPNGLGDMIAALLLAHRLDGLAPREALVRATGSVFDCLAAAVSRGSDELMLETDAELLRAPRTRPDLMLPGTEPERHCVGVDACKRGWISVERDIDSTPRAKVHKSARELLNSLSGDAFIAIDIPIGFLDHNRDTGRGPEKAIRQHLGKRGRSVFPVPSRIAIEAITKHPTKISEWAPAHDLINQAARETSTPAKGVPRQLLAILPKIQEIDLLLRLEPALLDRVFESHPEAAFWQLNARKPLAFAKSSPEGGKERLSILLNHDIDARELIARPPPGAAIDDVLDACAMLLVAERRARGVAVPFPDPPLQDAHGIPIAIWT